MIGLLPDRGDNFTGPCSCGCGVFFINGMDNRRTETMHHTKEGLYFGRNNDGCVTVALDDHAIILEPSEWATVLAHVSMRGADGATHAEALTFHTQDETVAWPA